MDKVRFFISGQPVGYYAQAGRSLYKMSPKQRARAEKYRAYQEKVRVYAMRAKLALPLIATQANPIHIVTKAYINDRRAADAENLQKGIKDALFYGASGGDKHTSGRYFLNVYNKEEPGVWVILSNSEDLQNG